MKKAIISFLFALSVAVSFGQAGTFAAYQVTNAGGTVTISPTQLANSLYVYTNGSVTLSNNYSINTSSTPPVGTRFRCYYNATNLNTNGYNFTLFGYTLNPDQLGHNGYYDFLVAKTNGVVGIVYNYAPYDFADGDMISGATIQDGTIAFSKLEGDVPISAIDTTGRGRIWYGNSTNQTSTLFAGGNGKILIGDGTDVNSVSVSGDIAITSAGVTSIAAGSIVNADVNASAAIALSKLAALTASKPVVTDGSGVLTTTNQVPANYGGTGQDFSASTGFQKWSAGTASVAAITDVRDLHVSFAANSQGTYYITFPVAATVTNIEARVETAIAGTDDATLEIQDNSGTDMTGNNLTAGLLTLAASATTGTGYTSTLTGNNTFTAGQRMRIISAKTTAGGTINVQVTYTRNE